MSSHHEFHEQEEKGFISKWAVPGVLAFIVVLLLLLIAKGCHGPYGEPTVAAESGLPVTTKDESMPVTEPKESIKVKLPDGIELNAFKGGIEDKLVAFLNDSTAKAGKEVWFDFDNLNFKSNSAAITEESNEQVKNIAAILKAYPKLKIKIGGYTDKTGDSTANLTLSKSRADAVLAALKTSGGSAAQLTGAEGYGSQFAKAAADAPDDDKKKDRRISVGVREK